MLVGVLKQRLDPAAQPDHVWLVHYPVEDREALDVDLEPSGAKCPSNILKTVSVQRSARRFQTRGS